MIRNAAAALAVSLPFLSAVYAQKLPSPPQYTYEVVSIHASAPGQTNTRIGPGPQGGLRAQNASVMSFLTFAYDVRGYQFAEVPSWV
jgi:hypothetical protein